MKGLEQTQIDRVIHLFFTPCYLSLSKYLQMSFARRTTGTNLMLANVCVGRPAWKVTVHFLTLTD